LANEIRPDWGEMALVFFDAVRVAANVRSFRELLQPTRRPVWGHDKPPMSSMGDRWQWCNELL